MKTKLLVCRLPKSPWWGQGTPQYQNNWAMKKGWVPEQQAVVKQQQDLIKLLKSLATLEIIDFPQALDKPKSKCHDFIFTRDSFISDQSQKVVVSNFAARERQPEAEAMAKILASLGYPVQRLPQQAYAEGGEFYFLPHERFLFAGISRNNAKGVEAVAKLLAAKKLLTIRSSAYHLDTIFTVLKDQQGKLLGIITCLKLIDNADEVIKFAREHHLKLIAIKPQDTINSEQKIGNLAVNCLPLPGVIISGHRFTTPGVEEQIASLTVRHLVTAVDQFAQASGGGVHCLTNELS